MGQALYRKYRSKKLSEIVGQEHITTALSNSLKKGTLSHAYLLTGPRGVGKTSIARILAHEINGLPYDDDATHLDIIEIDAASNRRIDEIRELREKVHNAPASAKYKVYIIDEVHMLTKEAFNALLKTLEEPPAHAVFILATTEAHKVPDTIISRTQRFTFKPIDHAKAVEHLKSVANKEKIDISEDALSLIAHHGQGSFRDSLSLLDQIGSSGGSIGLRDVQQLVGIAPDEVIGRLLDTVFDGTTAELLSSLDTLHQGGYQPAQIARQLSGELRRQLLGSSNTAVEPAEIPELLNQLLAVSASHNPGALLELTLLKANLARVRPAPAPKPTKVIEKADEEPSAEPKATAEVPEIVPVKPEPMSEVNDNTNDDGSWQAVLQAIKRKHNTLYGIARMAVPEFDGDTLTLKFAFAFHQKRLNEEKNRTLISDILEKHTGKAVTVRCIVEKDVKPPKAVETVQLVQATDPLDTISNIFGPSEVLES